MSRFADIGAAVIGTGFIGTVHVEHGPAAIEFTVDKGKVEAAVTERKSIGADYIGSIAQATGRAARSSPTSRTSSFAPARRSRSSSSCLPMRAPN